MAFREQTAGHNALLLLVALGHHLLEAQLRNAALDVHARAAEVELLQLVEAEADQRRSATRATRSRRKKSKHPAAPAAAPSAISPRAVPGTVDAAVRDTAPPPVSDGAAAAHGEMGVPAAAVEAPTTPTLQQRPPAAAVAAAPASRSGTAGYSSVITAGRATPDAGPTWGAADHSGGECC